MSGGQHFINNQDGSDKVLNDFTYANSVTGGYFAGDTKQSEYNDGLIDGFVGLSGSLAANSADISTLQALVAGSSGGIQTRYVTKTAHGFVSGDLMKPLYEDGGSDSGAGTYQYCQGDSATHARMLGVLYSITDANHFTLAWGYMPGFSGLTASSPYYLDPSTPGAWTTTKPTTSGQVDSVALYPVGGTRAYINLLLDPHVVP